MAALIEAHGLHFAYGKVQALRGIDLSISNEAEQSHGAVVFQKAA